VAKIKNFYSCHSRGGSNCCGFQRTII